MPGMDGRYSKARDLLEQRMSAALAAGGMDPSREANAIGERFNVARKHRSMAEYKDVAEYLISRYAPEAAYAIAVEINEQFVNRVGYPPIGQIFLALEAMGDQRVAEW